MRRLAAVDYALRQVALTSDADALLAQGPYTWCARAPAEWVEGFAAAHPHAVARCDACGVQHPGAARAWAASLAWPERAAGEGAPQRSATPAAGSWASACGRAWQAPLLALRVHAAHRRTACSVH